MKKIGFICLALAFASTAIAAEHSKVEFGCNCAVALPEGVLFRTNCSVSEIYKESTYCFFNQSAKEDFLKIITRP